MKSLNRRTLIKSGLAGSLAMVPGVGRAVEIPRRAPMLNLHERFRSPVIIDSVDQLRVDDSIWFRVRSRDGASGLCPGNDRLKVTVEQRASRQTHRAQIIFRR